MNVLQAIKLQETFLGISVLHSTKKQDQKHGISQLKNTEGSSTPLSCLNLNTYRLLYFHKWEWLCQSNLLITAM